MATNYVQPGKILTLIAPYNRTSGQGALVGSIFGVALQTVLINVSGEFQVDGVWTLAKTSAQAWAVGDKIYWDDNNKRCDTDSTLGKLIGVATAIAANPSSTGNVRLNGSAGATAEGLGLDTTELGLLNGATAGSITASKVVTRTAAQGIPLATAVVAAVGSSASDGAALTKDLNLVTGADNATCVVLPVGVAGERIVVVNTVANKVLPVFPNGTENINGGGAGVVFTMGPARAAAFVCTAPGVWYVEKLAAATPNATELALLTGAGTGGTPVASKVQVADANQNIGVVKATALHLGASGSETQVTATGAEINVLDRAGAAGVAEASKAVVLDANAHVDAVKTAALSIGATGAEVALTATPAELNALASAVSGLGSSNAYTKADTGTKTLVALHGTKQRGVLVIVEVTEVFATVGGAGNEQPVWEVGETDTIDKCFDHTKLVDAAIGKYIFGFTNTVNKAIVATLTPKNGNGTGAGTITVIALPNS